MAEDVPQPPALEGDHSGPEYQVFKSAMQQQRQKNELKRLLKHTHPELTTLDQVLDKELIAVLNSETEVAADEKGYEGEVFSKCLMFENCATSKMGSSFSVVTEEEIDKNQTITTVHKDAENHPDPDKEVIDEDMGVDVQSARRMFEEQSLKAMAFKKHEKSQDGSNVDEVQPVEIKNEEFKMQEKEQSEPQISDCGSTELQQALSDNNDIFDEDIPEPEEETFGDLIKTSMDLFCHNPFIKANIEKEHSFLPEGGSTVVEDSLPANVKNRKHLFESMPFDKIRQQNKDDIETMVENIRETLLFLYSSDLIQSKGLIIEVHETMIATKARFGLTEIGPEIMLDTVVEGGAQNLILQLLPRARIKPHVKYLKEDSDGAIRATIVCAPMHQNNLDTDFKTANIVQLIEDILNQDNSLRKGVLIQEEVDRCAEVCVYSLYHYVDGEDVKSYCPPLQMAEEETSSQKLLHRTSSSVEQTETKPIQTDLPVLNSGLIESAIHCLQETSHNQMCASPVRPEITSKGNVKLFKSCIEKGDLEYLRALQAEAEKVDEELNSNSTIQDQQNVEEATQYEPVDIKKLKGIFSAAQTKKDTCKNYTQMTGVCKTQHKITSKPQLACSFVDPIKSEDDDCIHQAELVSVVDEVEEIVNLQTAISDLQKAAVAAKEICDSLQERQDKHRSIQASFEKNNATTTSYGTQKANKELCQDTVRKEEPKWSEQKLDFKCQKNKELPQKVKISHDLTAETESEEIVFEGKLQAALQSLERSNINVTRGDFKAAMIYRNHAKPSKETASEKTREVTGSQDIVTLQKESQGELTLVKSKKKVGPKPGLPPKPEHMKIKTKENQLSESKTNQTNNETQSQKAEKACSHLIPVESQNIDSDIIEKQDNKVTSEQKIDKEETDESHVNFHEACQKFGGKKTAIKKIAPVKPQRVKIAVVDDNSRESQDDTTQYGGGQQTMHTKSKNCEQINEQKVEMREKKVRKETEDQRRQRLSVHMDEIMRGNMMAAMEIFDNLRKQEELENILIRVEEIEQDTSEVDVKSLRKVFEDVPDWVVSSDIKREKIAKVQKEEQQRPQLVKQYSKSKSSMAHVFGDLERASTEIIHLKEQTLARLLDIEEAIKKALCSVSNLKSESDIAGLSSLFKESLGAVQTPTASGNISTISVGSRRTKTQDSSLKVNENQGASGEGVVAKQQASPTSSPAFISIQSAARKTESQPEMTLCSSRQHGSKPDEKFRTTKTVQCNSPASVRKVDPRREQQKQLPVKPKRELSVLEVQTESKNTSAGTKTITENYERTDNFGNKFYSTKKSTVLTTEPQTVTTCPTQTVVSPAMHQVSTYPEVRLPINKKHSE